MDNEHPQRFSAIQGEGLRFHVFDCKYEQSFIVDLSPEALKNHEHGECECREFYFHVHIKHSRTTCVHLNFLINHLTALREATNVGGPRFKGDSDLP